MSLGQSTASYKAAARLASATPPPAHILSRGIGWQVNTFLHPCLFFFSCSVSCTKLKKMLCGNTRESASSLMGYLERALAPLSQCECLYQNFHHCAFTDHFFPQALILPGTPMQGERRAAWIDKDREPACYTDLCRFHDLFLHAGWATVLSSSNWIVCRSCRPKSKKHCSWLFIICLQGNSERCLLPSHSPSSQPCTASCLGSLVSHPDSWNRLNMSNVPQSALWLCRDWRFRFIWLSAAVGLSFLQFTNMNSMRNLFIVGVSIFLGLSVPEYFFRYTMAAQRGPAHTKAGWVRPPLHYPLAFVMAQRVMARSQTVPEIGLSFAPR